MTIENLQDHKRSSKGGMTLLFAGPSGMGKSIAACSWPGPIYVACLDDRMTSVRNYYAGSRNDINVEIITEFDQLDERVDEFEHNCPYSTVIIDPLTFLSDMTMRYSFNLRGSGGADGSKGRKKGVIDLTTVEDFGVEYQGITQIVNNLKIAQANHGFNLIVIAHVLKTDYYKEGGKLTHSTEQILTQGRKIAAKMPSMFDEVYYFYNELVNDKLEFKIRTVTDGTFISARSSFPGMPPIVTWTGSKNVYKFFAQYYNQNPKTEETK